MPPMPAPALLRALEPRRLRALPLAAALACLACTSYGQSNAASLFEGADLALGRKLIEEHRCVACHVRKVGGDGSAIYRPNGRINTPGLLRGMVEQCNTDMNLGLFPEEVTAIAAVLDRDHYRLERAARR
jgi:hypothetical protein